MRKRRGMERFAAVFRRLRRTIGSVELRVRFKDGEIVRIEEYTDPTVHVGRGAARVDGSDDDAV